LSEGEVDARFNSTLAKAGDNSILLPGLEKHLLRAKAQLQHRRPPLVKADVREDLDNPSVEPADFFDKYGTHYLSSVAIGCKVTVSCALEISKISSTSISAPIFRRPMAAKTWA
jgi:hypothetical protein